MTLILVLSLGFAPQFFGASASATKIDLRLSPFGVCQPHIPRQFLLSSSDLPALSNGLYETYYARRVEEPIVTEPVEVHVLADATPAFFLTESRVDLELPRYNAVGGKDAIASHPHATVEFSETVSEFHRRTTLDAFFKQMSAVDPSVVDAYSAKGLRTRYFGSSSSRISLPGSTYVVETLMPNAPKLVVFDLRLGSLVVDFAFYGGVNISVASESSYVNLGVQRLMYTCDSGSTNS